MELNKEFLEKYNDLMNEDVELALEFSFCSLITFSSIVSLDISFITSTIFFWPILCALSLAWDSTDGFHHGSKCITTSALCRFKPVPPDFKLIRNMGILLLLNVFTSSFLFLCDSVPSK